MAEPTAKRAKRGDDVRTLEEYQMWLKNKKARILETTGFSSKIYRYKDFVVKEQFVGLVKGTEWRSLQLYRGDVPGIESVREKIMQGEPLTDAQMENVLFLNTHVFSEEVVAMDRASTIKATPFLQEWFYVDLGNNFRLGITVQRKLHRIFWEYERKGGMDEMVDVLCAVGFRPFEKMVDSLALEGICYFDWNCGNMGLTETMQLRLIDFACALKALPFELRQSEKKDKAKEADILWRKTVMYRAMVGSWEDMASKHVEFRAKMHAQAISMMNRTKKLCTDFMHEYALPDTDFEKALKIEMLSDL